MEYKLIDITTRDLLVKFGSGNHKPGSGSACSFQGLLSAQMLRTVINLTNEPKRNHIYGKHTPAFLKIKRSIDDRIYPELERLFQLDSEQFDMVIKSRKARDKERDFRTKRTLASKAEVLLIISTETPLEIAKFCIELGEFAVFVFENGFRSARGDSGVAISSAISAIYGCLSIIELNLISLPLNEKTKEIRSQKTNLKFNLEKLNDNWVKCIGILEKESIESQNFSDDILKFQLGNLEETVSSYDDIENIVRELQNTIWQFKEKIFKNNPVSSPLDILKPDIVLKRVMNYYYTDSTGLGMHSNDGEKFEVAGLINKPEKVVQISNRFSQDTQRFTAAHELGHAILHKKSILHRDKPIDGSISFSKNAVELQADKFATFFLMPKKLVEKVFFNFFKMQQFRISEATALAIRVDLNSLRKNYPNFRDLSRLIASQDFYAGRSFSPLNKVFNVSVETMAIRLEELRLVAI